MRRKSWLAAAMLPALCVASSALGIQLYGGGTLQGTAFNPGAGVKTYMNCFVSLSGGATDVKITDTTVDLYRFVTGGNFTAVSVNIYATEMTFDGTNFGIGADHLLGTINLPGGAGAAGDSPQTLTGLNVQFPMELNSNPGLGGFWIGVEFTGPNAGSNQNGWRTKSAPTVGLSYNGFGMFNYQASGVFQAFFGFGNPPGSIASRFGTSVSGTTVGGAACTNPATVTHTEAEACGNDSNGGCNDPVGFTEAVTVNSVISGTAWADNDTRDTDWYEFTVTDNTQVKADVYSDGAIFAILTDGNCPATALAVATLGGCPRTLTACVPAGTYRLVVLPIGFSGLPCGSGTANNYKVVMSGTPCSGTCGSSAQDCCTTNPNPGCSDQSCCETVCSVDVFCCVVVWDDTCAGEARDFCGTCVLPANDECFNAIPITDGVTAFDTSIATDSAEVLPAECDEGGGTVIVKDIWYTYDATCDGTVTVSTCNDAGFDTRLAAYDRCDGNLLACNDDGAGCTGFTSTMTVDVVCGATYIIRLGGFANGGTGNLTISCSGTPCTTPCMGDLNSDHIVNGADLGILIGHWGSTTPGDVADLNGDHIVNGADLGILIGHWGACP